MTDGGERAALAATADLVRDAVANLRAAGVPSEVLGVQITPRRLFGLGSAPRIRPAGEAWRVGALLLLPDGALALPGETVRTAPEGRRGHSAESARHRADLREQARRGGIPAGVVVHLDHRPVTVGQPPAPVRDGATWFTWSPGAEPVLLAANLAERVALMLAQRED